MAGSSEYVARRLYREVWTERRYEVAAELIHPDFSYSAAPGMRGPEAKLKAIRSYHSSFPDLTVEVDDMVVGEQRVAVRFVIAGTDLGGLRGMPASGKVVRSWGVDFFGFSEGLIISDWTGVDWLGVLVQLEAVPDPWTARSP